MLASVVSLVIPKWQGAGFRFVLDIVICIFLNLCIHYVLSITSAKEVRQEYAFYDFVIDRLMFL